MINHEVLFDVSCFYCRMGALGVKKIYNKKDEWETGWYFCLNCGRQTFIKPEQEKVYA